MPRFLIHPKAAAAGAAPADPAAVDTATEYDADNWMVAVSQAMERSGITAVQMSRMVCDIDTEGIIAVQVPGTGRTFVITQLDETREEISSSIEAVSEKLPPIDPAIVDPGPGRGSGDGPLAADVDAPEPRWSPAFADRDLDEADLDRIIEQSHRITSADDFASACQVALDILLQVVPAESASVLRHVPENGTLRFIAARGPRSEALTGVQMPQGQGIAGLVWRSGTSLLIREVSTAPHHYQVMDQATGYRTRGLLAVPLRTATGVAGVLELLNPFGAIDFEERHQDAATIVAGRLAARIR